MGSGGRGSAGHVVPHLGPFLPDVPCRMYNRVYRPGGLVRWTLLIVAVVMFLVCGAATVAAVRGIILNWSKYEVRGLTDGWPGFLLGWDVGRGHKRDRRGNKGLPPVVGVAAYKC